MSKTKIPLEEAFEIAIGYTYKLSPFCYHNKCKVAGSIRREVPIVGDIEIICKPKPTVTPDMFGGDPKETYLIYDAIKKTFAGMQFVQDGPRKKMILLPDGLQVEILLVLPPAQWGYKLSLATGPADWNKYLVTRKCSGGAFPETHYAKDGAIYTFKNELVKMDSEERYYEFLGIPWVKPQDRVPPETWVPF